MKWQRKIRFGLGALFGRDKFNAEMEAEMRMHLELRTEKNISAGMAPEEAHYAARRSFGGLDQIKEQARAQRGGVWLGHLLQDLRYGLRMLRKSPVFTAVAVLSLALGIGASAAIFSLVNAILLNSLPVPYPQELRVLNWSGNTVRGMSYMGSGRRDEAGQQRNDDFSLPSFLALRKQCDAQAEIFGYVPVGGGGLVARARREAVSAEGLLVSGNFFSGLGVRPLLGDLIGPKDLLAGAAPVVVLSYRWWEQQFSLDRDAIGQQVVIDGHSFTVIGILPRDFLGVSPGTDEELYVPLSAQPQLLPNWPGTAPDSWWIALMARLRPGVSDTQFRAALDVAFRGITEKVLKQTKVFLADGSDGWDLDRASYRKDLLFLLGVVGVVLLVACANLAGLSLARSAARQHELSVRIALGAGRWRLMQQLLTESILLSLLGGGVGSLIAIWGKAVISRLLAGSASGLHYDTSLDPRVLGFALAVSLITALLSGLPPALKAGRIDPLAGLKDRESTGAVSGWRAGQFLVAAQVALSLLLVIGAGLYVRTLINLVQVNPGFAMENLLLFRLNPGDAGYKEPRTTAYYEKVQQTLAAIPGVRSAALMAFPILAGGAATSTFTFPDNPLQKGLEIHRLDVGETFFATLGIPMVLGRALQATDGSVGLKVAVVNEAFVHKYLPEEIPIGQTMKGDGAVWQIVGVCRDSKYESIKTEVPPTAYFSFRQNPMSSAFFVLRTELPPLALATAARKVVAAIDPNIPLINLETQEQVRNQTIKSERTFAALCGSLAVLAVFLSCIGLYGLMAYDVTRRTKEMGIRQALGATPRQIAEPILRRALALACAGVAVGVPLTLALGRVIHANLYGLKSSDPATLCGAAILLLAVALIAAWIPARRAVRVDPMVALRSE